MFSKGRHVGGEIWVEEGGVGSAPQGRPGRRQRPDGINRPGHRYRVNRQPVVVRTGAWNATSHGKGTGDWWCFTALENGRVCLHRGASSCTNMPSACLQVTGGPQGGARQRPCGMANPPSHNWCWLGTTLQCLLLASGGKDAFHDECPDDVVVWATLWGDIVASMSGAVYRPNAVARLLAMTDSQVLLCASVVVGVNVSGGLPSLSGCNSLRWLSVGSTWYRSWFVLVFALCLTACLMSNGGSGAQCVT